VRSFLAAVAREGIAPALSAPAARVAARLSSWGLLPAQNIVPLEQLEQRWPIKEPERWAAAPAARLLPCRAAPRRAAPAHASARRGLQHPAAGRSAERLGLPLPPAGRRRLPQRFIQKRSLPDVFSEAVQDGGSDGAARELLARFLEPVQLQEPSFGEVLLLYRCGAGRWWWWCRWWWCGWWRRWWMPRRAACWRGRLADRLAGVGAATGAGGRLASVCCAPGRRGCLAKRAQPDGC
jgi:hypothetical protein